MVPNFLVMLLMKFFGGHARNILLELRKLKIITNIQENIEIQKLEMLACRPAHLCRENSRLSSSVFLLVWRLPGGIRHNWKSASANI